VSVRTSHDLVVVGDGPAGRALGASASSLGLDVLVIGRDEPWRATYGAWADDVDGAVAAAFAATAPMDAVTELGRRSLARDYGVFDNTRLRAALDVAPHRQAPVSTITRTPSSTIVACDDGAVIRGRVVVDARGSSGSSPDVPEQRAYGVVLDGRPPGVDGSGGVLMDWRSSHDDGDPTFLYVVPLGDGRWLAEETSLARRPSLPLEELRRRLVGRLGADIVAGAERIEEVSIPMQPGVPDRRSPVPGFGAAARYVHPATGYSVAASLRAAPRVAAAVESAVRIDDATRRSLEVWNAVWPAEQRRARALHDFGLAALLRLPAADIGAFFDAFFALPTEQWASYLRVDTSASEVSRVMSSVFATVPWSVRRRLAVGSPLPFARLLR
jgi:lycopene beta-cyclase